MGMDREVKRKLLHASVAVIAVPLLLFIPLLVALGLAIVGLVVISLVWWLERRGQELKGPAARGQRMVASAMDHTMRPEEDFPWAPYYFTIGLIVIAVTSDLFGLPLSLAFAAYAVLGIGDTASALIGKAYGTLKIPWNRDKSWEGTGAGVGSAYPWAVLLATFFYVSADLTFPLQLYWIVFVGTVVGMLVETLPGEDNLLIPITSWLTMVGLAFVSDVVTV